MAKTSEKITISLYPTEAEAARDACEAYLEGEVGLNTPHLVNMAAAQRELEAALVEMSAYRND